MKILHVTPSYYPATYWGGPIFSTYALCNALAGFPDVELRVLASDMAGPSVSQRVPVTGFPMRYPAGYDVYFTSRVMGREIAPGLLANLWGMVSWADAVLLTGTYSFPTIPTLLACRLSNKPLIWSPRGALQASHEWAGASRPSLKRLWEKICWCIQPQQCILHVTAEAEKQASLARLPGLNAVIIPNGIDVPPTISHRVWMPEGILRLMFISRLDPKKGLEKLLHAVLLLDRHTTLDVYGTGGRAYVRSLQQLVDNLQLSHLVRFHGHVDGEEKLKAFAAADLFVLPSHSENFGMVVAEALAHGVPAIVSYGAPWSELDSRGCGRWVGNDPETLAASIDKLRNENLEAMGKRGRAWMQESFGWQGRARQMKAVFDELYLAAANHDFS